MAHDFLFDATVYPPPVPHTKCAVYNLCIPFVTLVPFLFIRQVIILGTSQIEIQLHHRHLCPKHHLMIEKYLAEEKESK